MFPASNAGEPAVSRSMSMREPACWFSSCPAIYWRGFCGGRPAGGTGYACGKAGLMELTRVLNEELDITKEITLQVKYNTSVNYASLATEPDEVEDIFLVFQ